MAEDVTNNPQTSQDAKPTDLADSTEFDLDQLLAATPEFAHVFGDKPEKQPTTETKKEPSPTVEGKTESPDEVQQDLIKLAEALPLSEPDAKPEDQDQTKPEEKPDKDAVQKRIDELTARRKTAEEKAAQLESELNDLKAKQNALPTIAPSPSSPLADITTFKALEEKKNAAMVARRWAQQNWDGGEIDVGDGKTQIMEAQTVRMIYAKADDLVMSEIPKRAAFLQEKAKYDQQAKIVYPGLFRAGTQEQLEYHQSLQLVPQLNDWADNALLVGDMLVGRAIRLAKAKNAAAGNGQVQPPPLQTSRPSAAPKVPQSRALSQDEILSIATDPGGGAFDKFVNNLIEDAQAKRSKR